MLRNKAALLGILSLLCSCCGATQVLLVFDAPNLQDMKYTHQVITLLPQLQKEFEKQDKQVSFTTLYPPCFKCAELPGLGEKQAVQAMFSMLWSQDRLVTELEQHLASASVRPSVVIGIGTPIPKVEGYPEVSFFELLVNREATERKTYNVPTLKGAYLDGVLAGMMAARGTNAVRIISGNNPSVKAVNSAFWQGVQDAAPDVCLTLEVVPEAVDSWDPGLYDAVERRASNIAQSTAGTDIVFTQLGLYNTAVLSAVKARTKSDYAMFVITGPSCGAPYNVTSSRDSLDSVWLSQSVPDWGAAITAAIRNQGSGTVLHDTSQSQWSSPNSPREFSKELSQLRGTACAGDAAVSYESAAAKARDVVSGKAIPVPSENLVETKSCPHLSLGIPEVRQAVRHCVDKTGNIRLVGVGVYINTLGNVDLRTGSYYADYNLYLHQSKTRYESVEAANAALSTGSSCHPGVNCLCPDFAQNERENFVKKSFAESFFEVVNVVNSDRKKDALAVFKTDTVGITGGKEEVLIDHFRIQGDHHFSPELSKWPLDTQELAIIIEGMEESTTDNQSVVFCHLEAFSGLSTSARYFPGMSLTAGTSPWQVALLSSCWPHLKYPKDYVEGYCDAEGNNKRATDVKYDKSVLPQGDLSCSCLGGTKAAARYQFNILFDRPGLPGFMKTFLPAIFITIVNQGVWFLYPKVYETRLGVCGSSLVSGVMYHVSLGTNTPEASVLTWADRFMIVVYYTNLLAFLLVFYQTVLFQAGMEHLAWKSFRATRIWGPVVAVISFVGVGVFSTPRGVVIWVLLSTACWSAIVYWFAGPFLKRLAPVLLDCLHTRNEVYKRRRTVLPDDEDESG